MGGNISAEQLMLYFNIALTVIVVFGALVGYIKGFKKSLFNLIKELIFVAGFFLTADLFANFILNSQEIFDLIAQFVPVNGDPANIVELVHCLLVDYAGVAPEATLTISIQFIFAIVSIALKLAYFVIYFIIIRILYSIICSIIYRVIFNRKNSEIRYKEKKRKNGKIKKIKKEVDLRSEAQGPRIFGLVFGACKSMITVTMIISLIMSIVSLLPKDFTSSFDEDSKVTASNKITLSNENKDVLADSLQGLEEYIKFIDDLENSPYVKLIRTVENDGQTLDLVLFDTILNGHYEEYNIRTRESLVSMINIGFDVYMILGESVDVNGQLDLNKVDMDRLSSLVGNIAEIDLLMDAIPVVIELGLSIDVWQEELPMPINEEIKLAIEQIDWKNDIYVLADVIKTLGEIDDLNEVVSNPINLLSKENEGVIKDVILNLADLSLFTKMIPAVVEYALELDEVKELVGDATVDLSNIVWEEELVKVSEIFSVFHSLSHDITSLLFVDESNAGEVIDGVNLNALNDLVLQVFELSLMEELFEPIMNIAVAQIEDEEIREMLNFDFDNYNDWAKEFTIIIDLVKELLADGNPFENGIDINIIKNVSPETLSKSKLLSSVLVSALVDIANGEESIIGDGSQELSGFIDVPSALKDKESPLWYNVYDEDGKLVSKGELHKTLEALQAILPEDKEAKMDVNDTLSLSLKISGATSAGVVFSSTNEEVAKVNEQGVVTAIAPGHATIIATTSNGLVKDMVDVIVKSKVAVPVEYVHIEGSTSYSIVIGKGQYNREFLSANTNLDASNQIIVWESLDEEIVKVSADGAIEGLKEGTAIVKATSNADPTKFAICTVTVVNELPSQIEVNKEALVGHVNKIFYVDASIDGSKEGLTYKVTNESIASVDADGFVKLLNVGETTLVVYNENKTITKTIKVLVLEEGLPTSIKLQVMSEGFNVDTIFSSLDQNDINTIIESDVLTRSLSKILLNALGDDGSSNSVHIPLSAMDVDQGTYYISKEELNTVLNTLLQVDLTSILSDGDVTTLLEDLEDDDIDLILESKVLGAFLSSTISTVGDGMIVVPSSAYKDTSYDSCYMHPEHEIKYIKNSEVKALVKMLKDYDLLSGNNLSIPLSEDNSELVELIESSSILRATLSKFIIDMANTDDAMIVVPDQALDTVDGVKMLKVNEFEAVLNALYDLGVEEISQELSLELNVGDLANAKESINNSLVLRATVSKHITPIEEIVVPDQVLDNSCTVNSTNIKVLNKEELSNLINALVEILEEDDSFDDNSLDLTVTQLKDTLDEIKASKILMATISREIMKLDALIVPDNAINQDTYKVDNAAVSVLHDVELENLVGALEILMENQPEADLSHITLDISVGQLKRVVPNINASSILKTTIGDMIIPLTEIVTPDEVIIDSVYHKGEIYYPVLEDEELFNLVNALESLTDSDARINGLDLSLTVGKLASSVGSIKESVILRATVSDKLSSVGELVKPDEAFDRNNYHKDEASISVIEEVELEKLVEALKELLKENLGDPLDNSLTLSLTIKDLKEASKEINSSLILRATVSNKINEIGDLTIVDESYDLGNFHINNVEINVLTTSELDGLVDSLSALFEENTKITSELDFDLTVFDLYNSIDEINSSLILRGTIANILGENGELSIPNDAKDVKVYHIDNVNTYLLSIDELKSLSKALVNILGDKSLEDIVISTNIFEDLLLPSNEANKNKLEQSLESKIIWEKVSSMIDNVTGEFIIIPNEARVDNNFANRITVKEINNLMKAFSALKITNIEEVTLETDFVFDLDDEIKDSLGNTELTRTTIALEKSKILMASIPSLLEEGINSAFDDGMTLVYSFDGIVLEGELNSEETAYVAEGELVRLFRAMRAANILSGKNLEDVTGKISDSTSSVAFIASQFVIVNKSDVLKPMLAQVLLTLINPNIPLVGDSFTDDQIILVLSQTAALQDLNNFATANKTGNYIVDSQITAIQLTASSNILTAATYLEVEAIYDLAVESINEI